MSVFLYENCKKSLAAGGLAPRPPWPPTAGGLTPTPPVMARLCQILDATQTLHIIFADYSCVDGTEMK